MILSALCVLKQTRRCWWLALTSPLQDGLGPYGFPAPSGLSYTLPLQHRLRLVLIFTLQNHNLVLLLFPFEPLLLHFLYLLQLLFEDRPVAVAAHPQSLMASNIFHDTAKRVHKFKSDIAHLKHLIHVIINSTIFNIYQSIINGKCETYR